MKQLFTRRAGSTSAGQTTFYYPLTPALINPKTSRTDAEERWTIDGQLGYLYVERRNAFGSFSNVGVGLSEEYEVLINGVASGLKVTIPAGENTASSGGFQVDVHSGDYVCLRATCSGGNFASGIAIGFSIVQRTVTRNAGQHGGAFTFNNAGAVASGGVFFPPLNVGSSATLSDVTDFHASSLIPYASELRLHNIRIRVESVNLTANTYVFTLMKNGVAQDGSGGTPDTRVSLQLVDQGGGVYEATGSASYTLELAAGDLVSCRIERIGSTTNTASISCSYGQRCVVISTEEVFPGILYDNLSLHCRGNGTLSNGANGLWHGLDSGINSSLMPMSPIMTQNIETDEAPAFWYRPTTARVRLNAAPGAGASRSFLYKRSSNGTTLENPIGSSDFTLTVSDTNDEATETIGATYVTGHWIAWGTAATGSPAACTASQLASLVWIGQNSFADEGAGEIFNITPATGPIAGGTNFTIKGTDFPTDATAVTVTLKGVPATNVTLVDANTITGTSGASMVNGIGDVIITFTVDGNERVAVLEEGWEYIGTGVWWVLTDVDNDEDGVLPDGTPGSNGPIYVFSPTSPGDGWELAGEDPTPNGWWWSNEGLTGAPFIVDEDDNPRAPRALSEIDSFATGAAEHLQGFPGCAVAYKNKLIYAARGYTVGTGNPPLRIFDGHADRFLMSVPKDPSGDPAEAIMAMIVANGTIYLSTLDDSASGGRVFEFNLETLTMTPLGAAFSGTIPYALCWHAGRLWCGTNDGDGTAAKLYSWRPGISESWTEEYDTADDSAGGICSLASYNGRLFIGTDNVNTANGKVVVRSAVGAYTVTETGSGTAAMNGYTAMLVFKGNLYAAYQDSAGPTITIRRYNDSAWSTVYTGADHTAIPVIALFTHDDHIYALFGASDEPAALIRSNSGDSGDYTDLTDFLFDGTILATPAFASVRF